MIPVLLECFRGNSRYMLSIFDHIHGLIKLSILHGHRGFMGTPPFMASRDHPRQEVSLQGVRRRLLPGHARPSHRLQEAARGR